MTKHSWIRKLFTRPATRTIRKATTRVRPALEALEDRCCPSTFLVTNTLDDFTQGSLRWAVGQANTTAGPNLIEFDTAPFGSAQTITVGQQLELTNTSGTTTIAGQSPGVTIQSAGFSRVFQVDAGVSASFSELTITGGKDTTGGGLVNAGTVNLTDCALSGNTATTSSGGGLANSGINSMATLFDCTISGNSAVGGGGLVNAGTVALTNCTISGNNATTTGGGLVNGGTATLTDCTVSGNTVSGTPPPPPPGGTPTPQVGGGLVASGTSTTTITTTLANTIVAGNSAPTAPDVALAATSHGHNLIGKTDGSRGWIASDLTGTAANPLDPRLAPLGDNGGPTQTMAELPSSPAINAGDPTVAPPLDQRGFTRSGGVDIGAYASHFKQQSINFSPLLKQATFYGAPDFQLSATASSGLPVTFTAVGLNATTSPASVYQDGGGNWFVHTTGVGQVIIFAHQAGDVTYAPAPDFPQVLTIFKAPTFTTSVGATFTYNGTAQVGGSGTVLGLDGLQTSATSLTYSAHADGTGTADMTDPGTYYVTAHYAGDANHLASDGAAAAVVINKATSTTTTVGAGPFTYNGVAQIGGSGTVTGVNGLSTGATSLTYSAHADGTGTADQVDAGTYYVTAHYAGDANHLPSDGNAVAVVINKALATISVPSYSVTFDGAAHTATGTAIGVGGIDLSSGFNLSGTAHTNAGTYNGDTWSFHDAGGNYQDASGTVNDSIAQYKALVVVTPYTSAHTAFDGNPHTATGLAIGVGGVNLSSDLNLSGTTHTSPGVYIDPWSFQDASGNYQNASGTVNDSIAQTTLTVQPTSWMGQLADSLPLTDLSLPGTYGSASGPSLADALFGDGSAGVIGPPTPLTTAAQSLHLTAAAADSAAILAGGDNTGLNSIAIAANGAAAAADAAAGVTDTVSGLGLASDIAGLASGIAGAVQAKLASNSAAANAAAVAPNAAAAGTNTALAGTDSGLAGTNQAAAGENAAAGAEETTAETANADAGTADATAATDNGLAGGADTAAVAPDAAAALQGGVDPVADGLAGGFDGTAAGLDATAVITDGDAVAMDTAATAADETSAAKDAAVAGTDQGVEATDTAAVAPNTEVAAQDEAAIAADGKAATANGLASLAAGTSAAANLAASIADGLTAQQYQSYANELSTTGTTGSNPINAAEQAKLQKLAVAEASTHGTASGLEGLAATADSFSALKDGQAALADSRAVAAVAAAEAANAKAAADDAAAASADQTAVADDAAAGGADAAAGGADATAGIDDAAAGAADGTAGIADGLAATADTAEVADTAAAIAADATAAGLDAAAVTADVVAAAQAGLDPVADGIAVAADIAAGIADGIAVAADALEPVADAAAAGTDGTAGGLDATAAGLDDTAVATDGTAAGLDGTAAGLDATAITADEAAAAANEKAAASDEAAAAADERAAAAIEAATAANEAATAADEKAVKADNLATAAGVAATAADIAFTQEVGNVENILSVGQTQSSGIADQLNAGVRSLDLRGTQVNDTINLNEGKYFTGATLQGALNDMTSFLQANPTETIVVSLSSTENPGGPVNSTNSFNTDLNNLLNSADTAVAGHAYKDFMYYSSNPTATPTLGQVRGKIVIMPAAGDPWSPTPNLVTGLTLGWKPTQVVQDTPSVTDPAARWNLAEGSGNTAGLIPTDLGNPNTLYRNNLAVTGTVSLPTIQQGDGVNAFADQALGTFHVTRTTGIVGMDDADPNLIAAVINENNLPIIVTSATDAAGDPNNLRAAITQANSQPGVNTIEFAPNLNGPPGQTIILLSDLPAITGDTNVVGPATIVTQHHLAFQHAATHTVTEVNFVASDTGPLTPVSTTYSPPLYVNTANLTIFVTVAQQHAVYLENQITNTLVNTGALSSGNGNALISKLSSAAANFASGNPNAGINDLHAFINAVTSYASQTPPLLTAAQAQTLIDAANAVIALAEPIQLVSSVGNTITAGTPFSLTVTAVDVWGNVLPTFTGAVKITDSVAGATLPGNYTFTTGTGKDNGVHTFTGLVLTRKGVQTLTVTDAKGKVLASLTVNVV